MEKIEQDKEEQVPFHRGPLGRVLVMSDQRLGGVEVNKGKPLSGRKCSRQSEEGAGAKMWQVNENRGMLAQGRMEEAKGEHSPRLSHSRKLYGAFSLDFMGLELQARNSGQEVG